LCLSAFCFLSRLFTVDHIIRNYFAAFDNAKFHKATLTAMLIFEERPGRSVLLTGDRNGLVQVWDIMKGEMIGELEDGHKEAVRAIAIFKPAPLLSQQSMNTRSSNVNNQDNRIVDNIINYKIITSSADKSVIIWDYSTRSLRKRIAHTDPVICIAVCDRNSIFAFSGNDKKIVVYDALTETELRTIITPHTDLVNSIAILSHQSREHSKIISVGVDKRMVVYDFSGKEERRFEKGHTKSITCLIAHYPSGEETVAVALPAVNSPLSAAAAANDTPILMTGSLDKTVTIWDFDTGKKVRTLIGHKDQINAIKVSDRNDDGSPPIVITASNDKTLILWDLLTGNRIRTVQHTESLSTLAILDSMNGIIIFSSGQAPSLLMWDLRKTARTREFSTKAVTAIDVYTPSDPRQHPQVIIGCVDNTFSSFDFITGKAVGIKELHNKRVNAGVIFPPSTFNTSPLVVSADGDAIVKVWDMKVFSDPSVLNSKSDQKTFDPTFVKKTFVKHKFVVLTVALYDPFLYGRTRYTDDRSSCKAVPHEGKEIRINLSRPCAVTGGADKTLKFWDFVDRTDSSDEIYSVATPHTHNIRSIVMYHPVDHVEHPKFITGSYDLTTILWDLQTVSPIRTFRDLHTEFVFFTAIYDPKVQFSSLQAGDDILKINPTVVTTSYDGTIGLWNMNEDDYRLHITKKNGCHKDSITALAVYTPPADCLDDPLIITGSIDRLVIIWNLFNGNKLQTLVGHTDRVCCIKIYDPPGIGKHPMILSGGDDEKTIVWEDALYQKPFMPLREAVNRAFDSDLEGENWPMITEMAEQYKALLFIENSNLFMIAVLKERPDFLLKFWDYLTLTLPTIKPVEFDFSRDSALGQRPTLVRTSTPNGPVQTVLDADGNATATLRPEYDILSIAIYKCDLVSVRAITLSWIKNLNQDMDNMLTQRVYHPSYFFPDSALRLLSIYYPSEFLKFITSLRVVRNYYTLMEGKQRKYLDSSNRYEFRGTNNRTEKYTTFWKDFHVISNTVDHCCDKDDLEQVKIKQRNFLDRLLVRFDAFLVRLFKSTSKIFDNPVEPQPVTSMVVPFKDCNNVYHYLKMFVDVSNQLNDVSIFESEIGCVFLRYFWHIRGRGAHVLAFFKYLMFLTLFLITIYAYTDHYRHHPILIILSALCIVGFVWYGYEEIQQMRRMSSDKAHLTQNLAKQRPLYSIWTVLLTHFADLWNAVDIIVVVSGIVGLLLRIGYGRDTPTGRSFLAITSVFMWFKILYFLRPFSTSGPLGMMFLLIISPV
jgi:WD40 repeat protein